MYFLIFQFKNNLQKNWFDDKKIVKWRPKELILSKLDD